MADIYHLDLLSIQIIFEEYKNKILCEQFRLFHFYPPYKKNRHTKEEKLMTAIHRSVTKELLNRSHVA